MAASGGATADNARRMREGRGRANARGGERGETDVRGECRKYRVPIEAERVWVVHFQGAGR